MVFFGKNKKNRDTVQPSLDENTETAANVTGRADEESSDKAGGEAVPSVKLDLKDKAAVDKRLREIYAMDSLYIILTMGIADLDRGYSIPMVIMPSEGERVILIFTAYEKARKYAEERRPMALDGVVPIAEIKKSDKLHNIDVICANAAALGITAVNFDVDDENGFGCKLPYFMELNDMSGQGQVVFTKEELEQIKANGNKFKPRFNAMPIIDFENPYRLLQSRADEVEENVLAEDGLDWARENAALHELCYTANSLTAKASDGADEETAEKYRSIVDGLNEIIFDKLAELDRWYTVADKQTQKICIKDGIVYLIYTPRYANRMAPGLTQLSLPPSVAELNYLIGDEKVEKVAVTDGPKIMHIIDRSVFGF